MSSANASRDEPREMVASAALDAAAILLAWGGAILAENVALGLLWRDQFSGPWEVSQARHVVAPTAVALLTPVAAVVAAAWWWANSQWGNSRWVISSRITGR